MRAFVVRCYQCKGFGATIVEANDAASAAKKYAADNQLGNVLLPLQVEKPIQVVTENSTADYIADQWSVSTDRGFRIWLYS